LDAIYDQREIDLLRSYAKVYIHSHTFCGTAPSLVEAMNLDLPIIALENDTNPKTTEGKAFFFNDSYSLKQLLINLTEKDFELNKKTMLEIAKRRYNWDRVVGLYENKYREVFNQK
jgi:glycosyltransferase involved in cell wall biosynthesis